MSTSTIKNSTPKAATPKATTPKAATPKAATPKAATPKAATPKAATPKAATPTKFDRISAADFDVLLQAIRKESVRAESSIQEAFLASWKDLACSHSTERLSALWNVLEETGSPYKAQVSLAMRALAGMAAPSENSQKWERTGRAPLSCEEDVWVLHLEDHDRRVLKERAAWAVHFRSIQVKPVKIAFTWKEAALFVKRIGIAAKQNRIPEKDRKKFQELLGEIERISEK